MAKSKPTLKYPDRKISDTFLQFTEPLLDAIRPNATEAEMEQPLRIAWTVWNAVVYADAGENGRILDGVRASIGHDARLKGFVEALIDRKRTVFGADYRLTGEYKLFRQDGQIRLRAEARDLSTKVQEVSTHAQKESQ